jgi:hypothetical protein
MQPAADYYKMTNVNGAPIPQVDIDASKSANASLFSQYCVSHGQTMWWKRRGAVSFAGLPSERKMPSPSSAAFRLDAPT